MKRLKSLLVTALVALLSVAFILPMAACKEEPVNEDANNLIYVTSMGGMALKNVTVDLLKDGESLGAKLTDEEGKVAYSLTGNTEYTVKLSGLPAGFLPQSSYTVTASSEPIYIRVDSKIIAEGTPKNVYNNGDVLYDFEQTYYTYNSDTSKMESRKAKLSDFFNEGKKAVLLNFWYAGCGPCMAEIPSISNAYKKYSEKIMVLGINDYPNESLTHVTSTVQSQKIPYLMCKDNASVGVFFQKSGWPLSVMIDRYGIMCETLAGTEPSQTFWDDWFEKYTSDNYSQVIEPDDNEVFVPDLPGDFNVSMPASSVLNTNTSINNTDRNITFSADMNNSSYGWPWDLNDDETAICPTNSEHKGTMAVIYAQIDLKANEVLAFDYKLSTFDQHDYFYVSLDSREGTGRQISMTSGSSDWQTGYSYAALEDGRHEIEFSYFRSTSNSSAALDYKVYINNLRIVTVDQMNANLLEKGETLEIPYFATRDYNNKTKQYEVIENVYLAQDGYYHIGTKETASVSDPYLLLDITHSTPYFGKNSENLQTLMNSEISLNGGMYIDNEDYTDTFRSYLSFSGNSAYTGLIPVTDEIKDTITALYKDNIPEGAKYYSEQGWLQFCVYYKQYGVQQELSDPIKGLAYFSAFKALETVGDSNYVEVPKGTGQFIFDEETGHYVDVEGTAMAADGNYNLNSTINKVSVNIVTNPRGILYTFTPTKSGVYSINGIDCYYYNNDESVIDGEATDAELFDGSLNVSHAYARPIAKSDSDRYERNNIPNSFKMIHYLEAGKTYYISVYFRVFETTGDFAFRIDYLGTEYSYISQASANVYTLDENYNMILPLYCEPYYDEEHDVWLDRKGGGTIFVDFTQLSAMFDSYTIEKILNDDFKSSQFTFDISKKTFTDDEGNVYDISLDLVKRYGGADKAPEVLKEVLKDYPIDDYTDTMKNYLEKSKEGNVTDEEYGLVPVNHELYCILQLFNAKFFGYDTDTEWLKACCFRMNVSATNRG